MGLNEELTLVAGVFVVASIMLFYVLKKLSKAVNRYFSRIERRVNDAAIYLSHVNEDKNHLEHAAKNKIERHWAETHLSQAVSDFKGEERLEKGRIKILIAPK